MEILDAHAEAVETEFAEGFEVFARRDTRIDFDADFGVGREREVIPGEAEKVFDLRRSQIGGSAAAPVELHHGAVAGNAAADMFDLSLQYVQIWGRDALVFLDDDVAGAEEAETLAKRDVHVERDGGFGALGLFVDFFEVGRAEGVVPNGRGGVAGVTRAGTVIAREKLFADAKLFAHALQTWICERHDKGPLTPIRSGFGFLQQHLLAGFDKELSIFDWSVLENAMAKIQDVADSSKRRHGFLGYAANFFRRSEKHRGIDIPLQGDAWAEFLAKCVHIHAPVDA